MSSDTGIVIMGFVIAFGLACAIGANDVANSFGTSVGSGVISLKHACYLASVCEILGSVLLGYKVSDTMRKGILEVGMYAADPTELMLGCLAALAASVVWLVVATYAKLPISGTHSIVGATIGFSLVAKGFQGLKWTALGTIVASWFISPLLSGLMSVLLFYLIRAFILVRDNPLKAGLLALPIIYGITVFINLFSVVHDGPSLLHLDNIATWKAFLVSLGLSVLVAIIVQLVVVPRQRKAIQGRTKPKKPVTFEFEDSNESSPNGSPKGRQKRPISLIIDGKQLPAITETTELVSLTNNGIPQSNGYCDPHLIKRLDFGDIKTNGKNNTNHNDNNINNNNNNNTYKIDPKIVAKAENLLGNTRSLDNTDLTVTSLNFIDEHNLNSMNVRGSALSPQSPQQLTVTNGTKEIQGYLDRQNSYRTSADTTPNQKPTDIAISIDKTALNNNNDNNNNGINNTTGLNENKQDLNNVESAGSLDLMIGTNISQNSSKVPLIGNQVVAVKKEPEDVSALFSFLQILTATFGSFAHGGNDVSNAIGPLIALWMIYQEGTVLQESETPIFLLLFGGVGISLGLWFWGRRVIETIGNDLTKITPSTGFTIEIGAAMTVLLASKIGLPISTTHCKVGSVVLVGYANKQKLTPEQIAAGVIPEKAVDWSLFRNIVYAWVITVPVTALLSAGFMYLLSLLYL